MDFKLRSLLRGAEQGDIFSAQAFVREFLRQDSIENLSFYSDWIPIEVIWPYVGSLISCNELAEFYDYTYHQELLESVESRRYFDRRFDYALGYTAELRNPNHRIKQEEVYTTEQDVTRDICAENKVLMVKITFLDEELYYSLRPTTNYSSFYYRGTTGAPCSFYSPTLQNSRAGNELKNSRLELVTANIIPQAITLKLDFEDREFLYIPEYFNRSNIENICTLGKLSFEYTPDKPSLVYASIELGVTHGTLSRPESILYMEEIENNQGLVIRDYSRL